MKRRTTALPTFFSLILVLLCFSNVVAKTVSRLGITGVSSKIGPTDASFDISVTALRSNTVPLQDEQASIESDTVELFSTDEPLNIEANIHPQTDDIGKTGQAYVWCYVNNGILYRDIKGMWHLLYGPPSRMEPATNPFVLEDSNPIEIINGLQNIKGHFRIFVGYKTVESSEMVASELPMEFVVSDLFFPSVAFPKTDTQKRDILASSFAFVNGRKYPIGYHTVLRSGDRIGGNVFGQLYDAKGNPLKAEDGSPRISNANDFASLHKVGNRLFMISHFESRPGAMYLTELHQDMTTGELTAISTRPIDFSGVRGGWVHCAGSVTPWNSHLGSEEYEPDAAKRDEKGHIDDYYDSMAAYYGNNLLELNPYDYGWIVEVTVDENAKTTVTKHYSMGRLAYELGYVLPDKRTVYMSDDGTNVGLFMFVADKEGDLSSGTLYAMKWHQVSAEMGGRATLSWISLGHATDSEIKPFLDSKIGFNDIFEKAEPLEAGSCPAGFTSINTTRGHECLKVKPGMEKAASRLETRRYAAIVGATTELRKEEGITYDPDTNRLYVAISAIEKGMEDRMKRGKPNDKYDKGGPNDIRVGYNKCGAVYALDLGPYKGINSNYVGHNMYVLVRGTMVSYPEDSPYYGNKCDINGLANPDNITYLPGYKTLIIGEDTGSGHQNDMIWAFDTASGELTRIQTTPYGSETTSPYWYPDINGFGYLISVVQHPYGESDQDKLQNPRQKAAYTGYIGPFPSLKK